jgi:hypothetical protein
MSTAFEFWTAFGHVWVMYRADIWAAALIAAVLVCLYVWLVLHFGPRDASSNGVAIGRAKQFDNRSLSLIHEDLNARLEKLSVLDRSIALRPDVFQESEAIQSSRTLSFGHSPDGKPEKSDRRSQDGEPAAKHGDKLAHSDDEGGSDSAQISGARPIRSGKSGGSNAAVPEFSPTFGMAAGDVLTDQINLLYQIVNLRLLNERALSDRLENGEARLQAVLGFQLSINPPNFAKGCVAVAEIEVKVPNSDKPVSVVAMIPQEKSYNAATLSSSANSVDGSVVSFLWRLGAAVGRRRSAIYLHRDTDTTAFERNTGWYGGAFGSVGEEHGSSPSRPDAPDDDANGDSEDNRRSARASFDPNVAGLARGRNRNGSLTTFGWEFHPVLGRRSVSPGARWMLAVVSLPQVDSAEAGGKSPVVISLRARTYWRRYHARQQTTSVRLGLWPLPPFGARRIEGPWYELPILRSKDVQESLSPRVREVKWTDVGGNRAIVRVGGENFFNGTEVTIGGIRYCAGDGNLVLKSDHAMDIHTTIAAIAKGDAVLSGRYGASIALLAAPHDDGWKYLWHTGVNIRDEKVRTEITKGEAGKFSCLAIPLYFATGAQDPGEKDKKCWNIDVFEHVPQPIICVDDFIVPQPYYFDKGELDLDFDNDEDNIENKGKDQDEPGWDTIVVRCYVPTERLVGATQILFKTPFMGASWAPATAMPEDRVTVDEVEGGKLIFRSARPFNKPKKAEPWLAILDKEYRLGEADRFVQQTARQLMLSVPSDTLKLYDKVLLTLGDRGYLLDLPHQPRVVTPSASLDDSEVPPTLKRGVAGVVDLKGSGLRDTKAVLHGAASIPFCVYADGSRLRLFLNAEVTVAEGELKLKLNTTRGDLTTSVFILDDPDR